MNMLRALATVSSMTLLSRILGYVRDFFIARIFGAGLATDAFFVAFRIPNLLRRMFAEGAFSQAFVPIFAEYRRQRGDDETHALVARVGTILTITLLLVTVAGVFAAPWLVYLLASGFAMFRVLELINKVFYAEDLACDIAGVLAAFAPIIVARLRQLTPR